jgi:hypothetical protein
MALAPEANMIHRGWLISGVFAAAALLLAGVTGAGEKKDSLAVSQEKNSRLVKASFTSRDLWLSSKFEMPEAYIEVRMLRSEDCSPRHPLKPRLAIRYLLAKADLKKALTKRGDVRRMTVEKEIDLKDFRRVYGVHRGKFSFRVYVRLESSSWAAANELGASAIATVRTLEPKSMGWGPWDYEVHDPSGVLPDDRAAVELRSWFKRFPNDLALTSRASWSLLQLGQELNEKEIARLFKNIAASGKEPPYHGTALKAIMTLGKKAEPHLLKAFRKESRWPYSYLSAVGGERTVKDLVGRLQAGQWIGWRGKDLLGRSGHPLAVDACMKTMVFQLDRPDVAWNAAAALYSPALRHRAAIRVLEHWNRTGRLPKDAEATSYTVKRIEPSLLKKEHVPLLAKVLQHSRAEPVWVAAKKLAETGSDAAALAIAERLADPKIRAQEKSTSEFTVKPRIFVKALASMPDRAIRLPKVRAAIESYSPPEPSEAAKRYDRQRANIHRVLHASLLARLDAKKHRAAASAALRHGPTWPGREWYVIVEALASDRTTFGKLCCQLLLEGDPRVRAHALRALEHARSPAGVDTLARRPAPKVQDKPAKKGAKPKRWSLGEMLYVSKMASLQQAAAFQEELHQRVLSGWIAHPDEAIGHYHGDLASLVEKVRGKLPLHRQRGDAEDLAVVYTETIRIFNENIPGCTAGGPPPPASPIPIDILVLRNHAEADILFLLEHKQAGVRRLGAQVATAALLRHGLKDKPKLRRKLLELCSDKDPAVRLEATWALLSDANYGETRHWREVANDQIKKRLLDADKAVVNQMVRRLNTSGWRAKYAAWHCRRVLERVTGKPVQTSPNEAFNSLTAAKAAVDRLLAAKPDKLKYQDISALAEGLIGVMCSYRSSLPGHLPLLTRMAESKTTRIRKAVAGKLFEVRWKGGTKGIPPKWAADIALGFLKDKDEDVRVYGARFFVTATDPRSIPILTALLEKAAKDRYGIGDADHYAEALGNQRSPAVIPALLKSLGEPKGVYGCTEGLLTVGDPVAIPHLRKALKSTRRNLRWYILRAMILLGDDRVKTEACSLLVASMDYHSRSNMWELDSICPDLLRYAMLKEMDRAGGDKHRSGLAEATWNIGGPWRCAAEAEALRTLAPSMHISTLGKEITYYIGSEYFGTGDEGRDKALKWFHLMRKRRQ